MALDMISDTAKFPKNIYHSPFEYVHLGIGVMMRVQNIAGKMEIASGGFIDKARGFVAVQPVDLLYKN